MAFWLKARALYHKGYLFALKLNPKPKP